jgi:hypothetical protein
MPNRLAGETSPYLRQHADNPVDWYPWGEEALARARAEDKPILLSIGYSACHWCHVMAHESFEDEATAALMNRLYVNIKVDREERPDIDDIYMNAVVAMTRRGGWPLTVFLTPECKPFYGGTYYPPQPRYGMPSFTQVLEAIDEAWRERRPQVLESADQLLGELDHGELIVRAEASDLNADLLSRARGKLALNFDASHGGFGGAPKFPQPMTLSWLLAYHHRTGDPKALEMTEFTLTKMAYGGIYDQIGGGFARYAVDAIWLVPHFEKMLYDNAQLSRTYARAHQVTGNPLFKRIAEETYDYILREMTAPEGGFYSATDADSEGEEGKFFVWSLDEVRALLSEDDAALAIDYYGLTESGNFEGHNILYQPQPDEAVARRRGVTVEQMRERLAGVKDVLFAARAQRVPPGLDDKLLTSWNGLMLASLAEGARIFNRRDYAEAARRAADFLLETMLVRGADGTARLLRTYNHGHAKLNGVLEDYAYLAEGLLETYMTTLDVRYYEAARDLADAALSRFRAPDGGFYDTADDHETLIMRPRSLQDNATPAAASLLARVLLRLYAYSGEARYEAAGVAALRLLAAAMGEYPQAFGEALGAVELLVGGVTELAVVGDRNVARDLFRVAYGAYRPNLVVAHSAEDVEGDQHPIPLMHQRVQRGGLPTAYVCKQFACRLPVTTPAALEGELKG